jgi:hypothetical protein
MATWRVASFAVRVRCGSTTMTCPPRARSARSLPGASATVIRLPFETNGLAPSMSRWSQRSRSGIGIDSGVPNIRPADTCLGIWSTVLAE